MCHFCGFVIVMVACSLLNQLPPIALQLKSLVLILFISSLCAFSKKEGKKGRRRKGGSNEGKKEEKRKKRWIGEREGGRRRWEQREKDNRQKYRGKRSFKYNTVQIPLVYFVLLKYV